MTPKPLKKIVCQSFTKGDITKFYGQSLIELHKKQCEIIDHLNHYAEILDIKEEETTYKCKCGRIWTAEMKTFSIYAYCECGRKWENPTPAQPEPTPSDFLSREVKEAKKKIQGYFCSECRKGVEHQTINCDFEGKEGLIGMFDSFARSLEQKNREAVIRECLEALPIKSHDKTNICDCGREIEFAGFGRNEVIDEAKSNLEKMINK